MVAMSIAEICSGVAEMGEAGVGMSLHYYRRTPAQANLAVHKCEFNVGRWFLKSLCSRPFRPCITTSDTRTRTVEKLTCEIMCPTTPSTLLEVEARPCFI